MAQRHSPSPWSLGETVKCGKHSGPSIVSAGGIMIGAVFTWGDSADGSMMVSAPQAFEALRQCADALSGVRGEAIVPFDLWKVINEAEGAARAVIGLVQENQS